MIESRKILVVFGHGVGDADDAVARAAHLVGEILARAKIIEDHFLVAHADENFLHLPAEQGDGREAADGGVVRALRPEHAEAAADHDVFGDVGGVEEIVAVLGRPGENAFVVVAADCGGAAFLGHGFFGAHSHALKRERAFPCAEFFAEEFFNARERAEHWLLEVIRESDAPAENRFVLVLDFDRLDGEAVVREVASGDRRGESYHVHFRSGKLHENVRVADLYRARVCGVDDRRVGKDVASGVRQERMDGLVFQNERVLPAFRVLAQDLAWSQRRVPLQRHEGNAVGIDALVNDGPLDPRDAVKPHRHGATLAPVIPREFFLRLDHVLEHVVADGGAGRDEARKERAHAGDAPFDLHFAPAAFCGAGAFRVAGPREKRVLAPLAAVVGAELARAAGGSPQVGAVGVVKLDLDYALCLRHFRRAVVWPVRVQLRLRAHERVLEFSLGDRPVAAERELEKRGFVHFDFRHCALLAVPCAPSARRLART